MTSFAVVRARSWDRKSNGLTAPTMLTTDMKCDYQVRLLQKRRDQMFSRYALHSDVLIGYRKAAMIRSRVISA